MNYRNKYLKYKIKYLRLKYGKKIPFTHWPDIEFYKMSDYIKKYNIYKKKYLLLKKIKEEEEKDSNYDIQNDDVYNLNTK